MYVSIPFVVPLDGGMSLLKHPSAAMAKLLVGGNGSQQPSLQRPVMAFVQQRHDLDSLQLAMKQGLRKAACRVFALQVGDREGDRLVLFLRSVFLFSFVIL